jgi:hypothetical protein
VRGFSVASLRTDLESLSQLIHLLIVISGAGAKPRHSHLPPEGRVVLSAQLTATKKLRQQCYAHPCTRHRWQPEKHIAVVLASYGSMLKI